MFLQRFAALTAILAVGVAACSGASNTVIDPLPHGPALSTTGTVITGTGVNGVTSSVTVTGSGNVNATESTTPPGSLPAIQSAARASAAATAAATAAAGGATAQAVKPAAAVTNTALVYLAITATSATSITGLAAASYTFANAPAGSVFQAYYNGTQWVTLGGAGNVSGTTVTFGAVTISPTVSLAAGQSLFIAVYTGGVLATPSPSPTATATASPTASPAAVASASPPAIADASFESGTVGTFGSSVSSTGWTQCIISSVANVPAYSGGINGLTGQPYAAATVPPLSAFTPVPNSTPQASIVTVGATAATPNPSPVPTAVNATPNPTQTTVPDASAGTKVAQLGGLYTSFNAADYAYNGLCQNLTVAAASTLKAKVFVNGNESSGFTQEVIGQLNSGGALTQILYMENPVSATSPGDTTTYRSISFPLPAGSYTLFIGQWTKAGQSQGFSKFSNYFWVDALTATTP